MSKKYQLIILWTIQIIIALIAITWLLACIMPDIFSLANGVTASSLFMILTLTFLPIVILAIGSWFMWRHYKRHE